MTRRTFDIQSHMIFVLDRNGDSTHAVVGSPADFYVFIRANAPVPWSAWIKGKPEIHSALKRQAVSRQAQAFVRHIEKLFKENPR